MNSKQVGNIALSKAISHFVDKGWYVFLPIGDNGGDIDLITVDPQSPSSPLRVQCKYTSHHRGSLRGTHTYRVDLRASTSRLQSSRGLITPYCAESFDFLFVATPEGSYLIPWEEMLEDGKPPSRFSLTAIYERYRVG